MVISSSPFKYQELKAIFYHGISYFSSSCPSFWILLLLPPSYACVHFLHVEIQFIFISLYPNVPFFSVWQCFLIYASVHPFLLLYLLHPASYHSLPPPSEVCVKYAYSTLVSSVYQSLPSVFHCLFVCLFCVALLNI